MQRTNLTWLFGVILLLAANSLFAQAQAPDAPVSKTRVGIGTAIAMGRDFISFGDNEGLFFLSADFTSIYLPILFGTKFRIEPEAGFFRGSLSTNDVSFSYTSLRLGFGIFPVVPKGKTNLYYGLRAGMNRTSITATSEFSPDIRDDAKTDFFIGPAIGGEYFFADHFSLGGEAQLNYVSFGQFDNARSSNDLSESAWASTALIFVRWYF
jgi:hypothetical protein